MSVVEPALRLQCGTGESPVWVAEESALYFTDIPGKVMHRFEPASGRHDSWPMPEELCAFAPREVGGFVAAMRSGFAILDFEHGAVDYVAEIEGDKPDNRLNDGRCDRQGRFWAGSMNEARSAADGTLYRLGTDRSVTAIANQVTVANGLAWSPDDKTMYWSDSPAGRIDMFDFDPETGNASNRRPFFQMTDEQGRPDGAAIDAEGFYWSACYLGGRILRIAPDGTLDREIAMPVRDITMVAFGGPDLDTLYITTANEALSDAERAETPLAGALFVADPGVRGLPEPRYRG